MPLLLLTSQAGAHSGDLVKLLEKISSFSVRCKKTPLSFYFFRGRMKVVAVAEPVEHRRKR